jgi:hypothetical protein
VGGIALVGIEAAIVAVFVALGDVAAGVHLVIHLRVYADSAADNE